MKKTIILLVMFTFAVGIFCGNVFAGEIVLFDFEQIPQDAKIKNIKTVEGVKGRAAAFDGFYSEWNEKGLNLATKNLFVEAWLAPREYSFNHSAVVNQTNPQWQGFWFGINHKGQPVAVMYADGKPQVCTGSEALPLTKWSHIAFSYQEGIGITLFLNGKEIKKLAFASPAVFCNASPLTIGRCQNKQLPLHSPQKTKEFEGWMRINGWMDEVRISDHLPDTAALQKEVAATGKVGVKAFDLPQYPSADIPQGAFGAYYTKLKYSENWDSIWRVSDHPDVVVRFPDLPTKFIFWRGTSYIPAVVTENNIWYCDQGLEAAVGECYEPMSDKQCRYSHVRIIETTPARCVVHWRYALSNSLNKIHKEDENGWGNWSDEYWTIYPDGVAIRKEILHLADPSEYKKHAFQFHQTIPLNQPGTRNEDNYELEVIAFADEDGNTASYSWKDGVPKSFPEPKRKPIQLVNSKSKYKPFALYESNRNTVPWPLLATAMDQSKRASSFAWWNHWPVAQFPTWSIDAVAPDKASCTCPEQFDSRTFEKVEFVNNTAISRQILGTTNEPITSLVPLARSWNHAPKLELKSDGYENNGYDVYERSYRITKKTATSNKMPLSFVVQASGQSPICNLALVVENIDKETVAVQLNGKNLIRGKDFETGFIRGLESGKLILWLPIKTASPIEVVLSTN